MKNTYYSTFISGFSDVIPDALEKFTKDTEVLLVLDGLIIYKTTSSPSEISSLPFFNNSFFLLGYAKQKLNMDKLLDTLPELVWDLPSELTADRTFRIIVSKENELTAISSIQLSKLESIFSKKLVMEVNRSNPDEEIWFLERSEGYAFCGLRLTKKPSTEKHLQKGQLRPELAWLLCFLSEPSTSDIFLDPFAGHGSIPNARTQFPYTKIISSDKNPQDYIKNESIEIKQWDVIKLPLPDNSVDKIVTDPPWGMHEKENVEDLYTKMLTEFERVLKVNGVLILVTSQKELFENILSNNKVLSLKEKFNILISGKKASVYKIWKN